MWCKAQGYRTDDNPTQGLTRVLPKQRVAKGHHAALPYQNLPTFVQALREADAGDVVKLAFEFTILCASRTSETLNTAWTEIDLEAKTWTIPGPRMKAGLEHRVPLSPRCIEILERTNVPRAVCEAALAHTLRDKTEAAYNRTDLFDRRRGLMTSWSRFATSKPADVVAIRA